MLQRKRLLPIYLAITVRHNALSALHSADVVHTVIDNHHDGDLVFLAAALSKLVI